MYPEPSAKRLWRHLVGCAAGAMNPRASFGGREMTVATDQLLRTLETQQRDVPLLTRTIETFVIAHWHHKFDLVQLRRQLEVLKISRAIREEILAVLEHAIKAQDLQARLEDAPRYTQERRERETSAHELHMLRDDHERRSLLRVIESWTAPRRPKPRGPSRPEYKKLLHVRGRVAALARACEEKRRSLDRMRSQGASASDVDAVEHMYDQVIDDISTGEL